MAYEILVQDGLTEVRVWGESSESEVLGILAELRARDPGKRTCDLWIVASECVVPFGAYPRIADTLRGFCREDRVTRGSRTAIVASDEFQKALLELYRIEAAALPFEVGVFMKRDEAMRWLRQDCRPAAK